VTSAPPRGRYVNSLTVGAPSGPLRWLINHGIVPRRFPPAMGEAWQRHNVEEVGSWQHFLPALHRTATT